MNNERYNQIIDEVYRNYFKYTLNGIETGLDKIKGYLDGCLVEYDGYYEHFTNPSFAYGYRTHNQEQFINKIKTDAEFSKKWGLKIEERELNLEERSVIAKSNHYEVSQNIKMFVRVDEDHSLHKHLDDINIPTKLITIKYQDETVITYE